MIVERGEYKGNKTIVFKKDLDDKYPFSFGLAKAKIIVEHIEDIKKFVEENDDSGKKPVSTESMERTNV